MRDPASEINSYLISNDILPPNLRSDSGQADIWRDYQQVLGEYGLLVSTRGSRQILLTELGLAFLDGAVGFTDLLTMQAVRWQYPNGHHLQRTAGSGHAVSLGNFSQEQALHGILIKPAALVWQTLRTLQDANEQPALTAAEIERFLIPARINSEFEMVAEAIIKSRRNPRKFAATRRRRNALDWIKLLGRTHLFDGDPTSSIRLSEYSLQHLLELDRAIESQLEPQRFWVDKGGGAIAPSWYLWFGTLDSGAFELLPPTAALNDEEFVGGVEQEEDKDSQFSDTGLSLRPFPMEPHVGPLEEQMASGVARSITSAYSAELSNSAHRLHDAMVRLIAEHCAAKQAVVLEDPKTVDLLVQYRPLEFLIEVKSATALSLARKIRMATGQVLFYDYLRSKQTHVNRRSVIALAMEVPHMHWSRGFISGYLGMDLLTLRQGRLEVETSNDVATELFSQG